VERVCGNILEARLDQYGGVKKGSWWGRGQFVCSELLLQVSVLEGAVAAFETERSLCSDRRGSEPPPEAAVGTG
jgi:hypothetical protein